MSGWEYNCAAPTVWHCITTNIFSWSQHGETRVTLEFPELFAWFGGAFKGMGSDSVFSHRQGGIRIFGTRFKIFMPGHQIWDDAQWRAKKEIVWSIPGVASKFWSRVICVKTLFVSFTASRSGLWYHPSSPQRVGQLYTRTQDGMNHTMGDSADEPPPCAQCLLWRNNGQLIHCGEWSPEFISSDVAADVRSAHTTCFQNQEPSLLYSWLVDLEWVDWFGAASLRAVLSLHWKWQLRGRKEGREQQYHCFSHFWQNAQTGVPVLIRLFHVYFIMFLLFMCTCQYVSFLYLPIDHILISPEKLGMLCFCLLHSSSVLHWPLSVWYSIGTNCQ